MTVFHEVHNPGLNMNVGNVLVKTKNGITKRYHVKKLRKVKKRYY